MEGRVEIQIDGAWSTICDDGWDDREAQMVCRTLTPYPFDGYVKILVIFCMTF